ncbi:MAG: DUF1153 domain-containing protein [Hyphomonadaceae bacterium]|nr:DUF1153 domain-containing protein [Hyphomonadaceae bacterium]
MEQQTKVAQSVRGPNGVKLTLADLPPANISRWVTRRKAEVVAAVQGGLLSQKEALRRYGLSEEEYSGWERLYSTYGTKGLRATRLQQYR